MKKNEKKYKKLMSICGKSTNTNEYKEFESNHSWAKFAQKLQKYCEVIRQNSNFAKHDKTFLTRIANADTKRILSLQNKSKNNETSKFSLFLFLVFLFFIFFCFFFAVFRNRVFVFF